MIAVKAPRRLQVIREIYPLRRDGIEEKTQQAIDLAPSCGIGKLSMHFAFCFAAVAAVSFGPEWLVVPGVVAYVATVG